MSPFKATNRKNIIIRRLGSGITKRILLPRKPSLINENSLTNLGVVDIAGVDEVGRGAWAGPLVAACVILNRRRRMYKIRDSKMLDTKRREYLYHVIINNASSYGIGTATIEEINYFGLASAIRIAGYRSILDLKSHPGVILLDGHWNYLKGIKKNFTSLHTQTITHGDSISLSIAAASIIAKVHRDNLMTALSESFPEYDFANNKGYPSPKHKSALSTLGPTPVHRLSYAPIRRLIAQ